MLDSDVSNASSANATTSEEVLARFKRSQKACRKLEQWRCDPAKQPVVADVLAHSVTFLNEICSNDVLKLCTFIRTHRREHALGNISYESIRNVSAVTDWHPAFAFSHLFHFVAEAEQRLPTFNEFREHRIVRDRIYNDARQVVRKAVITDNVTEETAKNAVRWRIGLAYYAFLKEQYVFAVLREDGFPVKHHPLADALFRVDCWIDDVNLDLYVGNAQFRGNGGASGRKTKSADLLSDAVPPFKNAVIECEIQRKFGKVHLPDIQHVRSAYMRALKSFGEMRAHSDQWPLVARI